MMFEMMRTTMGIIADIIFSVGDIERDAADQNQALTAVFEVLTARTTAFQQLPLWVPTADNRRIAKATEVIEAFILPMIAPAPCRGHPVRRYPVRPDRGKGRGNWRAAQRPRNLQRAQDAIRRGPRDDGADADVDAVPARVRTPRSSARLQEEVDTVLQGRAPGLDDLKRDAVHGEGAERVDADLPARVVADGAAGGGGRPA